VFGANTYLGVVRSVGPGTEFNVTADHVGVARTDGLDDSLFVEQTRPSSQHQ
jgi:hypothetical protein